MDWVCPDCGSPLTEFVFRMRGEPVEVLRRGWSCTCKPVDTPAAVDLARFERRPGPFRLVDRSEGSVP